ncbi:hypothetical protein [Prevotella sp. KH2C16]|uniref:hypothetical protein n=1 Tax=Prevotella sp. KH2C16 TaxID=1855325 RepID=UPI0008E207BC|nr:hypothetical protein [Prevotella sp. KH2C16]SFG26788.1 hypothetical protein SAMN05216383_10887 [Prevotella sp. KH2C16]
MEHRKKDLIVVLSALGVIVVGLVLYLLSVSPAGQDEPPASTGDSIAMGKDSAAFDTEADMRVIRDYYEKAYNGSVNTSEGWKKLDNTHLTPLMAERSVTDEDDHGFFIRNQQVSETFLKTLRVCHIKGNWYMVSWKRDYEPGWEQVPVCMVTARSGRRVIGYVTPAQMGTAASDTVFYPRTIAMPTRQTGGYEFVKAFYKSYFSTFLTIDTHALEIRKQLENSYMSQKVRKEETPIYSQFGPGTMQELIGNLTPKGYWRPSYSIYSLWEAGWYCLRGNAPARRYFQYIKVEKAAGSYRIVDVRNVPPGAERLYRHPIYFADDKVLYRGGQENLDNYIIENAVYPADATKTGRSATLPVALLLNEDGSLASIEVAADLTNPFAAEAMRSLKGMTGWTVPTIDDEPASTYLFGKMLFKTSGDGKNSVRFVIERGSQIYED